MQAPQNLTGVPQAPGPPHPRALQETLVPVSARPPNCLTHSPRDKESRLRKSPGPSLTGRNPGFLKTQTPIRETLGPASPGSRPPVRFAAFSQTPPTPSIRGDPRVTERHWILGLPRIQDLTGGTPNLTNISYLSPTPSSSSLAGIWDTGSPGPRCGDFFPLFPPKFGLEPSSLGP